MWSRSLSVIFLLMQSWRCGSHPVKHPARDVTRMAPRTSFTAQHAHSTQPWPVANNKSKYRTIFPHKSFENVFKYILLSVRCKGVRHARLRHSWCLLITVGQPIYLSFQMNYFNEQQLKAIALCMNVCGVNEFQFIGSRVSSRLSIMKVRKELKLR